MADTSATTSPRHARCPSCGRFRRALSPTWEPFSAPQHGQFLYEPVACETCAARAPLTFPELAAGTLRDHFAARQVHLDALAVAVDAAPATRETAWQRRLVARARWSTWLSLSELDAAGE